MAVMVQVNYTSGYVVYNEEFCYDSWLLLPAENLWPAWIRGILYTMAIFYLFLGIAIAADVFMLSIEMITSKKRIVVTYDYEKAASVEKEVYVWNETVANLTLMALGSSAPEILIATIETLTNLDRIYDDETNARDLGTFTIIGSAAYNLLVISAVCIMSVPSKTVKRIGEFGVFVVTSIWSLFAYFWLLVILKWSSPNKVEIWEAVLTLSFFPLLVISAWCQDRGWWRHRCMRKKHSVSVRIPEAKTSQPYTGSHVIGVRPAGRGSFNFDPEVKTTTNGPGLIHKRKSELRIKKLSESKSKLRNIVSFVKDHEANNQTTAKEIVQGIKRYMEPMENKSLARARFRHAAISSLIKGNHILSGGKSSDLVCMALKKDSNQNVEMTRQLFHDQTIGNFSFSSSSYSVVRSSRKLDVSVLFHVKRRRKVVGFSHIVEAAKKATAAGGAIVPATLPDFSINRAESSGHSVASQRTCISTIDEFDDSFSDIAYHHSISNSDSGFVPSRSSEERSSFQASVASNKRVSKGDIELTDFPARDINTGSISAITTLVTVEYETRDGTAKQGEDFVHANGSLSFMEHEYHNSIRIPIKETDRDANHEEKYFFIILKSSCELAGIGDPSIAKVSIINDNEPGELMFQEATYHVDYATGIVTANVVRIHGSDGSVFAWYRTINGTAFGGSWDDLQEGSCDFQEIKEERLEFLNGETSKEIKLRVNLNSKRGKSFILLLYSPSGGARLGHRSAAIITLTTSVDDIVDQVANIMTQETKDKSLMQLWNEQFYEAMTIGDSNSSNNNNDDHPPSALNYILHFLSFFWKVLLAFIPPRTLLGGWVAFVLSLLVLGILAAFVEQFAKLLGCVFSLEISVTGITIVALGTSMPDTFASRSAAVQDDSADASIGNITGSNSVNVFLGLGLPWVIKTIYYRAKGKEVKVVDANLTFSVTVFLCCGVACLLFLVLRRKLFGGELGGPRWAKYGSGLALIMLWAVFVTLCSFRAYDILPKL